MPEMSTRSRSTTSILLLAVAAIPLVLRTSHAEVERETDYLASLLDSLGKV